MSVRVLHGDCVELMRGMPDNSVDAIVTDPPYGLEFMGKEWDAPWKAGEVVEVTDAATNGTFHTKGFKHGVRYSRGRQEMLAFQDWFTVVAAEALRVLKPGGHLLAFGGTRTYHRMACAIEDAGFEIRDSIHWVYGSGFPKSLDVSKAIDKAAGAEREVVGVGAAACAEIERGEPCRGHGDAGKSQSGATVHVQSTAPATPEARRWEGWGTALKPAHEPVVVARKPLSGTVAGNVLVWGTGGLNIDGCRVGTTVETWPSSRRYGGGPTPIEARGHDGGRTEETGPVPAGRWPANVVFDRVAGEALDQQSGVSVSKSGGSSGTTFASGVPGGQRTDPRGGHEDKGGASRFFTQADFGPDDWPFVYQAKPSRKERNAGLDGLEQKPTGDAASPISNRKCLKCGLVKFAQPHCTCAEPEWAEAKTTANANSHPTVKPVALMRHLVRLVTPPGGVVLDPFAGSGTTLVAAVLEGFDAIGCEMTDEYLPIIEGRVAWAEEQAAARGAEQVRLL